MESTRQLKLGRMLQKEIAQLLQFEMATLAQGSMVTVTIVRVTADLSVARIYLSIFAAKDPQAVLKNIQQATGEIRYKLGKLVKGSMRKIPELSFFLDDSMDYYEHIDQLLKDA